VSQYALGDIPETLHLLQELIPRMITDLVDEPPMTVGDFGDMGSIEEYLVTIYDCGLILRP